MTIAFVGYRAVVNESAVTATTIAVPPGVGAGVIMVACIATTGTGTINLPAGWSPRGTQFRDGGADFRLCYRISNGSEPASYSWTHGIGASGGQVIAYSGIDLVVPIAASGTINDTVDATEIDTPAVAVPSGGWFVYLPTDRRNNAAVAQSWSTNGPSDVRRGQISGSGGSGSVFSTAAFDNAGADSGTLTRTLTAMQLWAQVQCWGLALNVALNVAPTGVASTSAVGTPSVSPQAVTIGAASVPSTAAVGTVELVPAGTVSPVGVDSQAQVGTPTLGVSVVPVGVQSTASVGSPTLTRFTVTLTLYPPTVKQTPMAWNRLHARYSLIRGISIIQRWDGTFYTTQIPAQTELEDAKRFWLGGYVHPLTPEEAVSLIDGGFGAYITKETIPA